MTDQSWNIRRRNFQRSVGVWADFFEDIRRTKIEAQVDSLVYNMNLPFGYRIGAEKVLRCGKRLPHFFCRLS
jgi:hypothetical protein